MDSRWWRVVWRLELWHRALGGLVVWGDMVARQVQMSESDVFDLKVSQLPELRLRRARSLAKLSHN